MFFLVPLSACHLLTFSRFDIAAASDLVDSVKQNSGMHGIYLLFFICYSCLHIFLFVVIAITLSSVFICFRSPLS